MFMKSYAVIQVGSRQYIVDEGTTLEVERQSNPEKIEVLMFSDGDKKYIGEPVLKDVKVVVEDVEDFKAKKIRVGRFKSKSRYRKVNGHRQPMTKLKIKSIEMISPKKALKTEEKVEKSEKKEETK